MFYQNYWDYNQQFLIYSWKKSKISCGKLEQTDRNMTDGIKKSVKSEFSDLEEMHEFAWRLIIRGTGDK